MRSAAISSPASVLMILWPAEFRLAGTSFTELRSSRFPKISVMFASLIRLVADKARELV